MKKAGKLIIVTLLILSGLTAGAYFFSKDAKAVRRTNLKPYGERTE